MMIKKFNDITFINILYIIISSTNILMTEANDFLNFRLTESFSWCTSYYLAFLPWSVFLFLEINIICCLKHIFHPYFKAIRCLCVKQSLCLKLINWFRWNKQEEKWEMEGLNMYTNIQYICIPIFLNFKRQFPFLFF